MCGLKLIYVLHVALVTCVVPWWQEVASLVLCMLDVYAELTLCDLCIDVYVHERMSGRGGSASDSWHKKGHRRPFRHGSSGRRGWYCMQPHPGISTSFQEEVLAAKVATRVNKREAEKGREPAAGFSSSGQVGMPGQHVKMSELVGNTGVGLRARAAVPPLSSQLPADRGAQAFSAVSIAGKLARQISGAPIAATAFRFPSRWKRPLTPHFRVWVFRFRI